MKFVGFISEHESSVIKVGDQLNELLRNKAVRCRDKERILHYLQNNTLLIAFLHNIFDDSSSIGPYIIYTDGKWIWPNYLSYYLKKFAYFHLPNEFIEDMVARNYIPPILSQQEKNEVEKFYVNTYRSGAGL